MAMFNQRKNFFKGKLFYIVLIGLFAFGIWLNQPLADKNSPDEVKTGSDYQIATEGAASQKGSDSSDIMQNIIGNNTAISPSETKTEEDPNSGEQSGKGYYLVKEIDGIIKIFYYNEEGKESLIRETDIAFSLLSVADQALFQKGVIKHTPEELDELLQDFES